MRNSLDFILKFALLQWFGNGMACAAIRCYFRRADIFNYNMYFILEFFLECTHNNINIKCAAHEMMMKKMKKKK